MARINPATQKNLDVLRRFGYIIAEVGVGEMACRTYGAGRMAEPEEIFNLVVRELQADGPLSGKRFSYRRTLPRTSSSQ
jgi:phosphopantothenoylcysteine decarboxylase/phosphopantothenate--cysteine ligase